MKTLVAFLLMCSVAQGMTKVAVIDSGLDQSQLADTMPLCPAGSFDFTTDNNFRKDTYGHGTNVAGLIWKYAKTNDICFVVLKVFTKSPGNKPMADTVKAFQYAVLLKVDFINYSGGGNEPEEDERLAVKFALDNGIKVVVAAGNDHADLKKTPYFPACYDDRIEVVQSTDNKGHILSSSNFFGPGKESKCLNTKPYSEVGERVGPNTPCPHELDMTGTSQATAIHTGKLIYAKYQTHIDTDPKSSGMSCAQHFLGK